MNGAIAGVTALLPQRYLPRYAVVRLTHTTFRIDTSGFIWLWINRSSCYRETEAIVGIGFIAFVHERMVIENLSGNGSDFPG